MTPSAQQLASALRFLALVAPNTGFKGDVIGIDRFGESAPAEVRTSP